MINQTESGGRLARLLPLLEADPDNLTLLADAAETALAEGKPAAASELLDRYAGLAELSPQHLNLAGLAAMEQRQFDKAGDLFGKLVGDGGHGPAVPFNLAWCRAMQKDFPAALELLDQEVCAALPQAAMLRVQILHELGDLDEAEALARASIDSFPDYEPLLAAVSVLALDIEDEELAAQCAAKAADHPDAMATLGTLALGRDDATVALELFDRALSRNSHVARAWIGRGLAELMSGEAEKASSDLDRGAEMFGDHIGSWIAAGWAYFIRQDLAAARQRFQRALDIDDTFAESHGSLAVLDLIEGDAESAQRRTEIALRLDPACYSAALAKALLAAGSGRPEEARRIFDKAINSPVDDSGRTIAQALARMGMGL